MNNKTPSILTYYRSPKTLRGFLYYDIEREYNNLGICVESYAVLIEFGKHYTDKMRVPFGDFISAINEKRLELFIPNTR